ncbi:MAG: hypothetical protein IKE18_01620 [Oscillospiraceae bacterium]|nr:hypothetical protein [Oscillospiraceae bacterium]
MSKANILKNALPADGKTVSLSSKQFVFSGRNISGTVCFLSESNHFEAVQYCG